MDEELIAILARLDESSRRALETAGRLAIQHEHNFLGIEHLVMALLDVTGLGQRLHAADVEVIRQALRKLLGARFHIAGQYITMTPRLFTILNERAPFVAQRRGHILVQPDDILIAVLQEEALPLVQELRKRGVEVSRLLDPSAYRRIPPLEIPLSIRGWCHDLTARAEQGELLPIIGREREIEQLIQILLMPTRLGPANPVLVGEAGVGKTAIVEGLAQRLAAGQEPALQNARIIQIDLNAMQAGTGLRGSFEDRIKKTIEFAQKPPQGYRIILFIDEVHQIIGAGLASGLTADAAQILLEPLGQGEIQLIGATTVEEYEECVARNEALQRRLSPVKVSEPTLEETRQILRGSRPALEEQFRAEGKEVHFTDEAIEKALELSSRFLFSQRLPDKPRRWLIRAGVKCWWERRVEVVPDDVIAVVSEVTGIPKDIIFRQARWTPQDWERVLSERVRGQDQAISALAHHVLSNLGPLRRDLRKPIGVFLFVGPTGVGKTLLAKALAELMFADEARMLRFDMSEFATAESVYRLIGPPRGIVGAGRGELTDRIRQRPYTILLLDEFDKAHPAVKHLFLQAFGEGWMADGLGRKVYFSDTIIIVTITLGQENEDELVRARQLSQELLNRVHSICIFRHLDGEALRDIARKMLLELKERVYQSSAKELTYTERAVEVLAQLGYDRVLGARTLARVFDDFVARELNPRLYQGNRFRIDTDDQLRLRVFVEDPTEEVGCAGEEG